MKNAGTIDRDWYAASLGNAENGHETIEGWFTAVLNADVEIDAELSVWVPSTNSWLSQDDIDAACRTIEEGV